MEKKKKKTERKLNVHSFQQYLREIRHDDHQNLINKPIRDGEVLVSIKETFVVGFFSPGMSTNYYVGIWYYRAIGDII